jgi:two-component system cell cycle response regulator CtrA
MSASPDHSPTQIRTGDLVIDRVAKTATVAGEPVRLKLKESQLIEVLSVRKDTVLTREVLLDLLYGGVDQPEIRIIDLFIDKLRRKLAQSAARIVETSSGDGLGFRLIAPPAPRGRPDGSGVPQRDGDVADE